MQASLCEYGRLSTCLFYCETNATRDRLDTNTLPNKTYVSAASDWTDSTAMHVGMRDIIIPNYFEYKLF